MKLKLLCVGRMTIPFLKEGCQEFESRLKRYLPVTINEIKEYKTGRKQDIKLIIKAEAESLAQKIPDDAFVIALDQRGKHVSSEKLADLMNEHMVRGTQEWVVMIGGPYGLSDDLRQRADMVLSLSALTLTHQMARLVVLEQIYRCCTIIRNEPYHH